MIGIKQKNQDFKTNRFQSGFQDLQKKIQTEQTVNRKISGFRTAPKKYNSPKNKLFSGDVTL